MTPPQSIDRNLLFAVIALQDDLIDQAQFADVCAGWALRMNEAMADLLIERKWMTEDHRRQVEEKLERKVKKHRGDVRAALGAISGADVRDVIRSIDQPEVRKALSSLPPAPGYVMIQETIVPPASSDGSPFNPSQGTRYRLTHVHGQGGLGKVWLARDSDLNREVAVKEMRPDRSTDPAVWRRFLKEAQITGQLEHPGIVPVYELTRRREDDQPFYVMRMVRGRTLLEAIADQHQRRGDAQADPVELQQLLRAFVGVCQAIGYAHSRGVVHRDLKPENVVLGDYGEAIVLDWGLARMVDQPDEDTEDQAARPITITDDASAEQTQGFLGTPAYAAPEQVESRSDLIDARTDVYGLGSILYQILTGRPPVEGPKDEVFAKIINGDITKVRERVPQVSRPLEAICHKALAKDRADRYAKATELADDVDRWIAGEPVSAWPEPWSVRARRWIGRNKTLVTAAAVGLIITLLGTVAYTSQRLATAKGRVEALRVAEIRSVPGILDELGGDRRFVQESLRDLVREGQPAPVQLRGLLALVGDEPERGAELARRLLLPGTTPDELIVIRNALGDAPRDDLLKPIAGDNPIKAPDDVQLRAFAALAKLHSDDPRWDTNAAGVAGKLTRENPLLIGAWREAFQPVARHLVGPLRSIYSDRTHPEARDRAYVLLVEFAHRAESERVAQLAALIPESDPDRIEPLLAEFSTAEDRTRAATELTPLLKPLARFDDQKAEQQGRVAAALLRLGETESVWPLFRFAEDPSTRTELIHDAPAFNVASSLLIDRLRTEKDISARRALLLSIGSYPLAAIPEADRQALATTLLDWYRNDPDPGVHGGVAWVLGAKWGRAAELARIDKELAGKPVPEGRGWFVNGQGQTYTIIRGPVEFTMGSTKQSDPDRVTSEILHRRKLPVSFAIAAREVTVDEYGRFLDENKAVPDFRTNPQVKQDIPSADCAMGIVDYYDAARYCNWLSQKEGLPESEWCYPKEPQPGMTLPSNYRERRGYRLPTEGEWEYAARTGALSSRHFGRLESRLGEYGWFLGNTTHTMHPTRKLKPNDLGLFDILGNAFEWCGDAYLADPTGGKRNQTIEDTIMTADFGDQFNRILRSGSFDDAPTLLRSASRFALRSSSRNSRLGIRPSRTYP